MHLTALPLVTPRVATVCCDVGCEKLNLVCRELSRPGRLAEWEIANRTESIVTLLTAIHRQARSAGYEQLRVVVEPTGIYHRLILRIARKLGFETALVDVVHVKKIRAVVFGDDGKTDTRDPLAIDAVATHGRLIVDRRTSETWQLLRHWGKLYHDAERALIDAKCRVHRALTILFPDFDFSTDFLYGPSGQAIFRCYGLDPHAIAALDVSRVHKRLRHHSRILRGSVVRLVDQARQTVTAIAKSRVTDLQSRELAFAWEDVDLALRRREAARRELEALYDEARINDRQLPDPTASPFSKLALARFVGETGPLADYTSWRKLLRMAGLNLRERKSGKYIGMVKIARRGRPLIRAIVNQMALSVVQRHRLYGTWYHHKISVQKMPGKKAMTAVGRKIVKLIWGWYQSGAAFDAERALTSKGECRRAA